MCAGSEKTCMSTESLHPNWRRIDDDVLFNRFTMEIHSCGSKERAHLDALDRDDATVPDDSPLRAKNIVTSDGESSLDEYESRAADAESVDIRRMRFYVTERCNMGCPGCFVRFKYRNDEDFQNSDLEKAKTAVDFLRERNQGESFEIHFLGGEPLIGLDLIEQTVEYAKETCEETTPIFSMTTNATIVTDEIAEYLDEEEFIVGVSFDGWRDTNDRSRVYMNGEGTFDDAVEGYWTLKEHIDAGVGILVTPQPLNIDDLDGIVERLVTELEPDGLTINDPFHSDGTWEVDGRVFAEKVKSILALCEEHRVPLISPASPIIKAVVKKQPNLRTLPSTEGIFTCAVSVDGRISYHIMNTDEALFPNHISDWSRDRFEEWATLSGYDHEKCRDCVALNTCGGPDPIESYHGTGDALDPDLNPERCKFYKHMTRWFIGHTAERTHT